MTEVIRRLVEDDALPLMINNRTIGFDPARGKYKHLVVHYMIDNHKLRKCVLTGELLVLP